MVAERASGFIYAVSRAGITGAREEMSAEAENLVDRVRAVSDLPVAVGFGFQPPNMSLMSGVTLMPRGWFSYCSRDRASCFS